MSRIAGLVAVVVGMVLLGWGIGVNDDLRSFVIGAPCRKAGSLFVAGVLLIVTGTVYLLSRTTTPVRNENRPSRVSLPR